MECHASLLSLHYSADVHLQISAAIPLGRRRCCHTASSSALGQDIETIVQFYIIQLKSEVNEWDTIAATNVDGMLDSWKKVSTGTDI